MQPNEIHLSDWQRILIGQAPWTFLIETGIRAIITFVALLACIRVMGKSVAGQLSASELAIIVTLGAAIGVPLEAPDRGMLPGLVVLVVAVLYQYTIGHLTFRHRRAELLTQGDLSMLVTDGRLNLRQMQRVGISRERLLGFLRSSHVEQLGQIDRVYVEAPGSIGIVYRIESQPGLSIFPQMDQEIRRQQWVVSDRYACTSCGKVIHTTQEREQDCSNCSRKGWEAAVLERKYKHDLEARRHD